MSSDLLKWTWIQCVCCDKRMPILSLCEKCRGTELITIQPLEKNPRKTLDNAHRHRLQKGKALKKAWIECSACQKRMQSSIFCSVCSTEASKLINQAYIIVHRKELVEE